MSRRHDAPRDLLLGLLALQTGLVTQAQLVAATGAWNASDRPMADLLVEHGGLTATRRALLEALLREHLAAHGGDAEQSLGALDINRSTRESLVAAGGPEVEETLAHVGAGSTLDKDADGTITYAVGTATEGGQRFRVLRPHARGGLGAVFVALDRELNREVALKQILDGQADDPVSRQRFLLEAEITGGLEHPGIVPVYGLGTYGGGRPYYAMRFIRGDSLKEAVDHFHADPDLRNDLGGRTLALHKLLRRFLDVCNAVHYAHARGIVHRDIKPGNIIVGRHGETLVVDWGLAKPIGHREPGGEAGELGGNAGEPTLVPSSASGSAETLPGSALGTPAYMSPEQAAGALDRLGARSDVYSLGATLYYALTGKTPFTGAAVDVMRAVQAGRFARPRELDPSVDRALEAICVKAMALEPEDRYATPRALADDVERWLADEPVTAWSEPLQRRVQRWMRRHRTAVTAATLAGIMLIGALGLGYWRETVYSASLTKLNYSLDAQRRRAEDREQEAIAAVQRFGEVVSKNPDLKNRPELDSLRKQLLKEPLSFFKSLRTRLLDDRETRSEALASLASACFELGRLTDEIGDKQDALTVYRESLAIRQKLADANPTNAQFHRDLGHSENDIGSLLRETASATEALRSYERARAIRQRLADANATVAEFQSDLAASHNNIAVVLTATGSPAEALRSYERARAIRQRLADANPTVTQLQSLLAASHNNIGNQLSVIGRPADALRSHERALAIWQNLADANPAVTQYQSDVARSLNNIGLLQRATGQVAPAMRAFERALAIWQKLADANPTVSEFQNDLAVSHSNIGDALRATGRADKALHSHEQALAIRQKLADANPTVTQFQRHLAATHHDIANLLGTTRGPADALREHERALAIRQKLADEDPTVPLLQEDLASTYNNIGLLLSGIARPAEALAAYERALAIRRKLTAEHPESPDYAGGMGGTLNNLAILDLNAGRFAKARDRVREAIAGQKKARAAYPGHPTYREFLNNHYRLLIAIAEGLHDTALAAEARQGLAELAATDPGRADLDARLAAVLEGGAPTNNSERLTLGQRAYDIGRYAAAARLWAEALAGDPTLASTRQKQHRYNAACAAALAAAGEANDSPVDDAATAKLRAQALGWLRSELSLWERLAAAIPPAQRAVIVQVLRHWQQDPDLAGVRELAAISRLPDDERAKWMALWADVAALTARASGAKSPPVLPDLPKDVFAR
jgi:serine/threonine-protein kinase